MFAGRLDEGERLAEEAVALNRRHGDDSEQEHTVQRLALALLRRRPQDAPVAALRDYAARYPPLPVWEAMLARAEWALRRRGRGPRSLDACSPRRLRGDRCARRTGCAAWRCSPSRSPARGRRADELLAAALAPHAGRNAVMDDAWAAWGPAARAARRARGRGRAARTTRPRHFDARDRAGRRAGRRRAGSCAAIADWLRLAHDAPDALRARGMVLARDLELPWVAADLVPAW